MPIHNIHMDNTAAARRSPLHLIRQMSKVRREYRGCQFDQMLDQDKGPVETIRNRVKAVEILARPRKITLSS